MRFGKRHLANFSDVQIRCVPSRMHMRRNYRRWTQNLPTMDSKGFADLRLQHPPCHIFFVCKLPDFSANLPQFGAYVQAMA